MTAASGFLGTVEYAALLSLVVLVVVLALVALGERTSDTITDVANTMGALGTESDSSLHVASIELEARTEGSSIRVTGIVRVHDQGGNAFAEATTIVTWAVDGTFAKSELDRTDGQGRARFSFRTDELSAGDVVSLTVDRIVYVGYSYDADSNVENSDQVVIQ